MKKTLAMLLVLVMVVGLFAGCGASNAGGDEVKVAMVTDYGDITDQSFNQATYEACKAFCEANNIPFDYKKPAADSTADRVAMVDAAVADGYNVIVMPGYAFAGTVQAVQDEYPDVTFIALDVSEWDLEDSFYNHDENGNRTELMDPENEPHQGSNVYMAVYQEELCGYMAGYAAVAMGYKHLGFLGGMAVPAVIRYGYGYLQGIDAAAADLGIADQVSVEYVYGGQFHGDGDITASMDTWYQTMGVEVVFACGGGIYSSAAEAAAKVGGKVIGVDTDQAGIIDAYGEGMTVTSAMKGLGATVNTQLKAVIDGTWDATYGGKLENLGLVSGEDPAVNYVGIPLESTHWSDDFTQDDYKAMVKNMFDGILTVSSDTAEFPTTAVTVTPHGQIK